MMLKRLFIFCNILFYPLFALGQSGANPAHTAAPDQPVSPDMTSIFADAIDEVGQSDHVFDIAGLFVDVINEMEQPTSAQAVGAPNNLAKPSISSVLSVIPTLSLMPKLQQTSIAALTPTPSMGPQTQQPSILNQPQPEPIPSVPSQMQAVPDNKPTLPQPREMIRPPLNDLRNQLNNQQNNQNNQNNPNNQQNNQPSNTLSNSLTKNYRFSPIQQRQTQIALAAHSTPDVVASTSQPDAVYAFMYEEMTALEDTTDAINTLRRENQLLQERLNNLNKQMSFLRESFQQTNTLLQKRLTDLQIPEKSQVQLNPTTTAQKTLAQATTPVIWPLQKNGLAPEASVPERKMDAALSSQAAASSKAIADTPATQVMSVNVAALNESAQMLMDSATKVVPLPNQKTDAKPSPEPVEEKTVTQMDRMFSMKTPTMVPVTPHPPKYQAIQLVPAATPPVDKMLLDPSKLVQNTTVPSSVVVIPNIPTTAEMQKSESGLLKLETRSKNEAPTQQTIPAPKISSASLVVKNIYATQNVPAQPAPPKSVPAAQESVVQNKNLNSVDKVLSVSSVINTPAMAENAPAQAIAADPLTHIQQQTFNEDASGGEMVEKMTGLFNDTDFVLKLGIGLSVLGFLLLLLVFVPRSRRKEPETDWEEEAHKDETEYEPSKRNMLETDDFHFVPPVEPTEGHELGSEEEYKYHEPGAAESETETAPSYGFTEQMPEEEEEEAGVETVAHDKPESWVEEAYEEEHPVEHEHETPHEQDEYQSAYGQEIKGLEDEDEDEYREDEGVSEDEHEEIHDEDEDELAEFDEHEEKAEAEEEDEEGEGEGGLLSELSEDEEDEDEYDEDEYDEDEDEYEDDEDEREEYEEDEEDYEDYDEDYEGLEDENEELDLDLNAEEKEELDAVEGDGEESYFIADEELDQEDLLPHVAPSAIDHGQYDFSEQVDEVANFAIKLDLVRAYLEMQDFETAEEVLNSIDVYDGSAPQQEEYKQLREELDAAKQKE